MEIQFISSLLLSYVDVDFKKLLDNAIRDRDRCSLEHFAMLSRFHLRGRAHDASVTRI